MRTLLTLYKLILQWVPKSYLLAHFITLSSKLRLLLSADNLCKQFGPRSGLAVCPSWSVSKLFDSLMVFQKNFFEKLFKKKKKKSADNNKSMKNYPACKVNNSLCKPLLWWSLEYSYYMGHHATKPVFGVSNQVIPKPACTVTTTSYTSEISLVASFDMIHSNKRITNALIRLCGWAGWSVSLLFANHQRRVFLCCGPYGPAHKIIKVKHEGQLRWACTSLQSPQSLHCP